MNEMPDAAFPTDVPREVLARVEKWPGVETHLLRAELEPGVPAFVLRDYLVGEDRYAAGAFLFPVDMAEPLGLMIIRGVVRGDQD